MELPLTANQRRCPISELWRFAFVEQHREAACGGFAGMQGALQCPPRGSANLRSAPAQISLERAAVTVVIPLHPRAVPCGFGDAA